MGATIVSMNHWIRIPVVCLMALLMGGCSLIPNHFNPFTRSPRLTGTWENKHSSQLTINGDGTFEITHAGHFPVTGTYSQRKDKITLVYTGGKIPWDGHESATYRVKKKQEILRFVCLHDTCIERIANLSTKWKPSSR